MKFTLFARRVLGLTLTQGQTVLAKVAFDGLDPKDLTGREREIARELFGDVEEIPPAARRTLVLVLGRNSGKTTLASAFALWTMLTADVSRCGVGDVPVIMSIAPDRDTAAISVRMALEMAKQAPDVAPLVEGDGAQGFGLRRPDGRLVIFEAFAASRRTTRGRTVLLLVMDESWHFFSGDGYATTDDDVYRAVAPRARRSLFITTPWPVPSLTGRLLDENYQHPVTALAAKAPTLVMRDHDPEIAIAREIEMRRDPENAAREYDCDTAAGSAGTFFDPAAVQAAAVDSFEVPTTAQRFAGLDPAYRSDAFARAIAARHGDRYFVLDLHELRPQRGAPLKPSEAIEASAKALKAEGVYRVASDLFDVENVREQLGRHGIALVEAPAGQAGKIEVYTNARRILHEGRMRFRRHPRLVEQLCSIVSKPTPGGGLSISAPRRAGSGHGDLVSALTLALWLGEQRPGLISPEVFERACRTDLPPELLRAAERAAHGARLRGVA